MGIQAPQMIVKGALRAEGTAARPIALTGVEEGSAGEWGGIVFESVSGPSLLSFTEVAFGGSGGSMIRGRGGFANVRQLHVST